MKILSINKPVGMINGCIMTKNIKYSYNHIVSYLGEPMVTITNNNIKFVEWHIRFEDNLSLSIISYFKSFDFDKDEEIEWMISADKEQATVYKRILNILKSKDWGRFNYIRNRIFKEEEKEVVFCECCECSPCDCDWGN